MSLFGFRSDKNVAVRKIVTSGISSALVVGTLVCTPIAIAEPISMTDISLNLQATINSQTLPIGNTTNSIDFNADNVTTSIDTFINKEKNEQTETTSNSDESGENETSSSDDGGNHPSGSVDDEPTSGGETPIDGEENQLSPTPVPPSNDNGNGGLTDGDNTTESTDASERSGGPSLFAVHTGNWGTVPWTFDDVTRVLTLGPGTGANQPTGGNTPSSTPWQPYRHLIKKVVFTGATGTTKAPANMFGLFSFSNNLESVEDPNQAFDTSATTRFELMFGSCPKLKSIDLRHWDLRNAMYTNLMFSQCTVLEVIDTSQWVTTTKLINMCGMFQFTAVKEIDLSGFDMTNVPAGATGGNPQGNANGSGTYALFSNCNSLRVLKLGPLSRLHGSASLANPSATIPYSGLWQELGTSVDYDHPNGSWVGTSVQLYTRSANVALAPGTYVWQRGFSLNGPPDFDFGQYNSLPSRQTDLHLFNGSYTAAEIAGGFDVYFVSSGTKPWHATAQLSNFTDGGGSTLPPGVVLNIDNLGLSRTDAAMPTVSPTLTSPLLQLVPGGPVTRVVGAPTAVAGKGVWKINMPFDDITLTVPRLGSAYLNSWSATLTWSLNDTV